MAAGSNPHSCQIPLPETGMPTQPMVTDSLTPRMVFTNQAPIASGGWSATNGNFLVKFHLGPTLSLSISQGIVPPLQ